MSHRIVPLYKQLVVCATLRILLNFCHKLKTTISSKINKTTSLNSFGRGRRNEGIERKPRHKRTTAVYHFNPTEVFAEGGMNFSGHRLVLPPKNSFGAR